MTVLADVNNASQFAEWQKLGATYTLLWDKGNIYTTDVYNLTNRPMFVVIDRDMTIQYRGSDGPGLREAEAVALKLLGSK